MVAFKEEIFTACFFGPPQVIITVALIYGPLAQLARAPALQAGCHQFESGTVHHFRIGASLPNLLIASNSYPPRKADRVCCETLRRPVVPSPKTKTTKTVGR